jgi:hypothetical protein
MSETRSWSLLIGGLSRAADMPGLAHQVVPRAVDIEQSVVALSGVQLTVRGGLADPTAQLGLGAESKQRMTTPRQYSIETSADLTALQVLDALTRAVQHVTPLPSGIVSDWTLIVALDDSAGRRIGSRTVHIPRGGGRGILSPSGMGGIALGGLAGAAVGGPVGAVIGAAIGGAAGEALERQFPSSSGSKAS